MLRRIHACALTFVLAGTAHGQWSASRLHPETALNSQVRALVPGRSTGGYCWSGPTQTAGSVWDIAAGTNLPATWWGPTGSAQLFAAGSGQMLAAGQLSWENVWAGSLQNNAVLWHSGPVSLAPPGVLVSEVLGAARSMQAGWIAYELGTHTHAALWRDTAASFVDLHPTGAVRSVANATDGQLQGGTVDWPGLPRHAAIWSGDAQSCADISPAGLESAILGMAPGVQVGHIVTTAGEYHAAVWRGGAFTDYNRPNWTTRLLATTGRYHVGQGGPGGIQHAIANFGGPGDWVDLHLFLPAGYTSSAATCIGQYGRDVSIGGYAVNEATGSREAFLWTGADPCYANCDGSTVAPVLNVNDIVCFINKFAAIDPYADGECNQSPPAFNVLDYSFFLAMFAAGCS